MFIIQLQRKRFRNNLKYAILGEWLLEHQQKLYFNKEIFYDSGKIMLSEKNKQDYTHNTYLLPRHVSTTSKMTRKKD